MRNFYSVSFYVTVFPSIQQQSNHLHRLHAALYCRKGGSKWPLPYGTLGESSVFLKGFFSLVCLKNKTKNFRVWFFVWCFVLFVCFLFVQTQYTLCYVSGTCIINKNRRPTSFTESLKVLAYASGEFNSVSQTCLFAIH